MATTPNAIANALAALVEDLAPTQLASDGFERYDLERPFEEYALDDIGGCWRKFELTYTLPVESPGHVNPPSGRWRHVFRLTVAYKRSTYKSLETPSSVKSARDDDFALIWPVLRDYTGATCVADEVSFPADGDEDKQPVIFMRIEVPFEFARTV